MSIKYLFQGRLWNALFVLSHNWAPKRIYLFFPTLFSIWVSCSCGTVCSELMTPFLCLKPVKAAVRNSATASHQAVPLAAGVLKLSSELSAQKLRLCSHQMPFSKILKSTFKNVLITSKLKSHLSNFCHFLKRKIGYISFSVRLPIRCQSSTPMCVFNFLDSWFSWIQTDTDSGMRWPLIFAGCRAPFLICRISMSERARRR